MKKGLKILFLLICLIFTTNVIFAAEEGVADGDDDSSPTQSQLDTQNKAIQAYCDLNATVNGCIYDKKNDVFNKTSSMSFAVNDPAAPYLPEFTQGHLEIPSGLKVRRGYQAFDGNGNGVYAACYRYDLTQSEYDKLYKTAVDNDELYDNITGYPGGGPGTYFVFTFVVKDKKKGCQVKRTEIIPAEGVKGYYWGGVQTYRRSHSFTYDGKTSIFSSSRAELNAWKAKNNGECPKVFGYTANTKWYTKDSNKYIFSENADDFNLDTIAFWSGEEYQLRPGCTVEDEAGKEKAEELLKEIKKEIDSKQCPSKIEDMVSFSKELDEYYLKLREDNEYRVLYSAGLIDEMTRENAQKEIMGYISDKLTSCQYEICNVSSQEQTKINSNKGSTCKNGCTLNNVTVPSEDPAAKCYCCGGAQGCTYKWMVPTSESTCALQENMKIGECIGTTKDVECRNCLVAAYEKSGLSQEQRSCLIRTELLKEQTELVLEDANEEAAEEDIQKEIEENRKTREEIFNNMVKVPDIDIYSESMSCIQLLGNNLVKVIKLAINIIRIGGVIASIVMAMLNLIPAVTSGDASQLNSAIRKCIWIAVALIIIVLFPVILKVIGNLFGFDLTCIF